MINPVDHILLGGDWNIALVWDNLMLDDGILNVLHNG